MNLPYSKVTTFEVDGNVYSTEPEAIKASVLNLVGNAGLTMTVLANASDLVPLLARYAALQVPTDSPKGTCTAASS